MSVRHLNPFVIDMEKFIKNANLPVNSVKRVISGELPESVKADLLKYGINIIETENNPVFIEGLSSHADLQFIHLENNRLLVCSYQKKAAKQLEKLGFELDFFDIKNGEYPFDCAVNAAFLGKKVICRFDILENKLKQFIINNGYSIVNVNQGYSKCSVCIVDKNSVITEDKSIKNACAKRGIDVLLIRKGFVKLKCFDYGFIGGASFKADEKTLGFIGKIENHPDFTLINDFLSKKSIKYISFGDTELTDVGSVIPINE